jgi:hypothetical protein
MKKMTHKKNNTHTHTHTHTRHVKTNSLGTRFFSKCEI